LGGGFQADAVAPEGYSQVEGAVLEGDLALALDPAHRGCRRIVKARGGRPPALEAGRVAAGQDRIARRLLGPLVVVEAAKGIK
jgi:hypothetical protein